MSELGDRQAEPAGRGRRALAGLRRRARAALPFASGVAAALAALLIYGALTAGPPPLTQREVQDTVAEAMASATPAPAFSAQVYRAVQPSFVLIQVEGKNAEGVEGSGIGSGVIVSDEGAILTSLHVVEGSSAITLTFADGTEASAEIVAAQPENDIAVLSASRLPAQLVPATLGNPGAMRVGDEVYAVGNPFGLYSSMSAGIVSGFNRSFQPQNGQQELAGLIQVDAAVNPGNSGGPLLNRRGQVVGIVVGIVSPKEQEGFIGIAFAVPIQVAGGAAGMPSH